MRELQADPDELYPEHLQVMRERTAQALEETGFDGVIFAGGEEVYWHGDDSGYPFRLAAGMHQWIGGVCADTGGKAARVDETPGHYLYFSPEAERPTLFIHTDPKDVWQLPPDVGPQVEEHFEVIRADFQEKVAI